MYSVFLQCQCNMIMREILVKIDKIKTLHVYVQQSAIMCSRHHHRHHHHQHPHHRHHHHLILAVFMCDDGCCFLHSLQALPAAHNIQDHCHELSNNYNNNIVPQKCSQTTMSQSSDQHHTEAIK